MRNVCMKVMSHPAPAPLQAIAKKISGREGTRGDLAVSFMLSIEIPLSWQKAMVQPLLKFSKNLQIHF